MPLDLAFGFAMVVFFFVNWIPHNYYSYAENLRGVLVVLRSKIFFLLGILYLKFCGVGCNVGLCVDTGIVERWVRVLC